LVRGGSGPSGLSSVVPSGFVLPRGFVEGIIREDETCPLPSRHARSGPCVLIADTLVSWLDARPAAWQTVPNSGQ
jgi:hypothetical protein